MEQWPIKTLQCCSLGATSLPWSAQPRGPAPIPVAQGPSFQSAVSEVTCGFAVVVRREHSIGAAAGREQAQPALGGPEQLAQAPARLQRKP